MYKEIHVHFIVSVKIKTLMYIKITLITSAILEGSFNYTVIVK